MAVVINQSGYDVEVFGTIILTGEDKHAVLGAGKMTDSSFDCVAVRAVDGGRIFETHDWWKLLRTKAVVYPFGTNLIVDDDLTLHCFPYVGPAPFAKGYEPFPDSSVTVDLDPDVNIQTDAPARGPFDGEFNRDKAPNADELADGISLNRRFGRYVRTGEFISVRVNVDPFFIDDTVWKPKADKWKESIETIWNNKGIHPNGTEPEMSFEIDYSDVLPHFVVYIPPEIVNDVVSFFGGRASYFYWPLDTGLKTVAHEFGHHLGLQDEYLYAGELPNLASAINQFSAYQGKKWKYSLTARFTADSSGNDVRAAKRTIAIPPGQVPSPTMMEISSLGVPDIRVIDRVYDQHVQPLFLTERHIKRVIEKTDPDIEEDTH